MEIILDSDAVKINYVPELNSVELVWKGYVSGAAYQNALNLGLETANKNNLTGWIADLTNMLVIAEEDQKWTNEVWFPQLLQSRIIRMGVVVSHDVFNQLGVEEILDNVQADHFQNRYFDTLDKARAWVGGK